MKSGIQERLLVTGKFLLLLLVPLSLSSRCWAQPTNDDEKTNSGITQTDDADSIDLPRKIRKALDQQVFPALVDGDDVLFYEVFGTILQKSTPAKVAEIESYAASRKLPPLLDHFVGIKIMRIEQGIDSASAKMSLKEAVYLVQGINGRLAEFVDAVNAHPFMHDPIQIPEDWKKSRDLFWDAHVIKNEFTNNFRLLEFGKTTLAPLASRIKNSREQLTAQVVAEFMKLNTQISELRPRLVEAEAEARVVRFRRSLKNLLDASDFEPKFVAAMNVELDAEVLVPFLEQAGGSVRQLLNDPQLANEIASGLARARTEEPEITEKAYLFRSGSHWWLRGRYGYGPLMGGMLKTPEAMKSENAMNALYMPRRRPKPDDAIAHSDGEKTLPYYVRRHYYTWSVEYRPLRSRYSKEKKRVRPVRGQREIVSQQTTKFSNKDFFL